MLSARQSFDSPYHEENRRWNNLNISELWNEFIRNEHIKSRFYVLDAAVDLFGEAVKCYRAEAYLACCICVRSAIEAALHIAKTRTHVAPRAAIINLEDTHWDQLKKWARDEGVLDKALETRVDEARRLGNLGAHLAQRIDRAHQDLTPDKPFEIQIWVSPKEAWGSLVTGKDLILQIAGQRWK
jgi:predicted DNA-binding ribbon-helix-helix protein